MMLGTGVEGTRRYLDYHHAVQACLPSEAVHVLPLMGLHPEFKTQAMAEQLLTAVHNWCAQDLSSEGVVLDTGNPEYLDFFQRQGYTQIGEVPLGPVIEHVFFHPSPETLGYSAPLNSNG
jgi:GNAT superfamily N-acetyltransferase